MDSVASATTSFSALARCSSGPSNTRQTPNAITRVAKTLRQIIELTNVISSTTRLTERLDVAIPQRLTSDAIELGIQLLATPQTTTVTALAIPQASLASNTTLARAPMRRNDSIDPLSCSPANKVAPHPS